MARPRKPIDVEQLKKCAEKQWSNVEIAAFFHIHVTNLAKRFAKIIEESRESGRAKLRDLQWQRALQGSDTMIKHMSEHYLGQRTKTDVEQSGEIKINLVHSVYRPQLPDKND